MMDMNTTKPLQQSSLWNEFQKRSNNKTFYKETDEYSYLGIKNSTPIGDYLYFPYGPYIKNNDLSVYDQIIEIAKKEKCIFARVEPQNHISSQVVSKFKKKDDINPSHTLIIDISKSKEEIISGFSSSTRRHYNAIKRTDLKVVVSKDPKDAKYLYELQSKLFNRKNLNYFPQSYFENQMKEDFATLYLCYLNDKVIGAVLYFDYQDTRYYMQAATDEEYRDLPVSVALVTSGMFDAKDKGLTKYDFWGIAPEGAPKTHPWYGFTTFKKRFGGEPVEYLGTYDIIVNPFLYTIYGILRTLNRIRIKLVRH